MALYRNIGGLDKVGVVAPFLPSDISAGGAFQTAPTTTTTTTVAPAPGEIYLDPTTQTIQVYNTSTPQVATEAPISNTSPTLTDLSGTLTSVDIVQHPDTTATTVVPTTTQTPTTVPTTSVTPVAVSPSASRIDWASALTLAGAMFIAVTGDRVIHHRPKLVFAGGIGLLYYLLNRQSSTQTT